MNNVQTVDAFVETLLCAPELTMQAVHMRLAHTDYELVLKKSDPLKHFESEHPDNHMFPFMTGERSAAVV